MLAGDVIRRRVSADALHLELLVGFWTRMAVSAQRTRQTSRTCIPTCTLVQQHAPRKASLGFPRARPTDETTLTFCC